MIKYCVFWLTILFFLASCADLGQKSLPAKSDTIIAEPPVKKPDDNDDSEGKAQKKPPQNFQHTLPSFNQLAAYVTPQTLVVFDIDATLIWAPGHTWPFNNVPNIALAEGNITLTVFDALKVQASNSNHNAGSKIMFLTARCSNSPVKNELLTAGITISQAWLNGLALPHNNNKGYHDEIFYACHTGKGAMLKDILAILAGSYPFDRIVFVDDQINNVVNVHQELKASSLIPSYALHYKGAIHPVTGMLVQ